MVTEAENNLNLEKCPSFERCSQNLCPLDYEFHLRVGGESDKCKWTKERKAGMCKFTNKEGVEREFYSKGSSQMPDNLLRFVPKDNVGWLNEISKKRWRGLAQSAS